MIPEARLALLERFSTYDVQDLVAEIRALRKALGEALDAWSERVTTNMPNDLTRIDELRKLVTP